MVSVTSTRNVNTGLRSMARTPETDDERIARRYMERFYGKQTDDGSGTFEDTGRRCSRSEDDSRSEEELSESDRRRLQQRRQRELHDRNDGGTQE